MVRCLLWSVIFRVMSGIVAVFVIAGFIGPKKIILLHQVIYTLRCCNKIKLYCTHFCFSVIDYYHEII